MARGGVYDRQQAVDDAAQREVRRHRQIAVRFEEGVDRRRQRAAAAVSEDDDQPQRLLEMLDRVTARRE